VSGRVEGNASARPGSWEGRDDFLTFFRCTGLARQGGFEEGQGLSLSRAGLGLNFSRAGRPSWSRLPAFRGLGALTSGSAALPTGLSEMGPERPGGMADMTDEAELQMSVSRRLNFSKSIN